MFSLQNIKKYFFLFVCIVREENTKTNEHEHLEKSTNIAVESRRMVQYSSLSIKMWLDILRTVCYSNFEKIKCSFIQETNELASRMPKSQGCLFSVGIPILLVKFFPNPIFKLQNTSTPLASPLAKWAETIQYSWINC